MCIAYIILKERVSMIIKNDNDFLSQYINNWSILLIYMEIW